MNRELHEQCEKLRVAYTDLKGVVEVQQILDWATWHMTKKMVYTTDMLTHVCETAAKTIIEVENFFTLNEARITIEPDDELVGVDDSECEAKQAENGAADETGGDA